MGFKIDDKVCASDLYENIKLELGDKIFIVKGVKEVQGYYAAGEQIVYLVGKETGYYANGLKLIT
jgi:hypothetical protein